ncbi:MAG: hypothetical protein K2P79_14640 [Sphingomonas sp.]|nr:hypothetical protein [Sphingomonas sp.]
MRFLLILVGLAALVVAALLATGMMTMNVTPGNVPHVALEGGRAPEVNANMAKIELGTSTRTIDVPTVTTTERTVAVPTLTIEKPANAQEPVK